MDGLKTALETVVLFSAAGSEGFTRSKDDADFLMLVTSVGNITPSSDVISFVDRGLLTSEVNISADELIFGPRNISEWGPFVAV